MLEAAVSFSGPVIIAGDREPPASERLPRVGLDRVTRVDVSDLVPEHRRITSYNVCYTKLLRRDPFLKKFFSLPRRGLAVDRLLFALRARAMEAKGVFQPVSREGALVLNNILLAVSASYNFV